MAKVNLKYGTSVKEICEYLKDERIFVIFDKNVKWAVDELRSLKIIGEYGISAHENDKTLGSVEKILAAMLEAGADRKTVVLNIGGGITSDVGGFAACIYMRGVRYVNLPTTMLAQVDAGLGGKTGVNFKGLKNIIGVIRQSEFTYICTEPLRTLPVREILCGAAEMIKSFIINNEGGYYERAIELLSAPAVDVDSLGEYVHRAAQIKSQVVEADENEAGYRRVLNLGHSYAHAIESVAAREGKPIPHGFAVGIGLVLAARLSEQCGFAAMGFATRIKNDLEAVGLPTECPFDINSEEFKNALHSDKKAISGTINFVLPHSIGHVEVHAIENPSIYL